MSVLSYGALRPAAREALRQAHYSPRKLVLLHTGVTVAVGLLLNVLTYLLDLGIAQTGGISGIQSRAMLETFQSILSVTSTVLLPFWEIGYLFALLQVVRQQDALPGSLLAGFRHWGVVLRGFLLKGLLMFAVLFAGTQLFFAVYMMTPWGVPLMEMTEELSQTGADTLTLLVNEAYMAQMMQSIPFVLGGALLLLLPVLYVLRFSDYVLMDQPELGAAYALFSSFHMTRRNFVELLKLDLHFWWYYLLEVLTVTLSWMPLALELLGIDLGMDINVVSLVCYAGSVAAQLGLYVWAKNDVFTTYVLAYEQIYLSPVQRENVKEAAQ